MRRSSPTYLLFAVALIAGSSPLLSQSPTHRVRNLDRARVERVLGFGTFAASSLKVVRPTGIEAVRPTAATVGVAPGDLVFRKVGSGAVPERGRSPASADLKAYQLPYRWLTIDRSGVERLLIPRLIVHGNGLAYDPAARIFRGKAMIGVEDSLHPGEGPQPLERPLRIQLSLTGPGEVAPNRLAIAHTSLEYDSVTISARDSVTVRVHTATDPAGIQIPVQVYRPTIELSALPSELQGFGLGTATISVGLPPGYSRTDTITVRFRSHTLNVRPARLRVTADADNEAKIRSGTPGRHTIRAEVDGMRAASTDVVFVWPWLFLSAALLGLVIGGAAAFFGSRVEKSRSMGLAILKGTPFGLLTAVAAALGLDWLGLHLDDAGTWMGVMLTSALGAYGGERTLKRSPTSPHPN
jgi:hypothetical protein